MDLFDDQSLIFPFSDPYVLTNKVKMGDGSMQLNWRKCKGGKPCSLNGLNLDSISDEQGVYVIWTDDNEDSFVIHVGQVWSLDREFKDRFSEHRNDNDIQQYAPLGTLYVTWAPVDDLGDLDGIERYLFDELSPLHGERAPSAEPIPVNLPDFI